MVIRGQMGILGGLQHSIVLNAGFFLRKTHMEPVAMLQATLLGKFSPNGLPMLKMGSNSVCS